MYANGSRYEGAWDGNQKHGKGTFTFEDGSVYAGVFARDRMAEAGVHPTPDLYGRLQLAPYLSAERDADAAARAAAQVQNLLTRHNTEVKQIYRFYAAVGCEVWNFVTL